jgi:alanine racemase
MGRLGVLPGKALDLLRSIRASSHLDLAGVMSHISSPEGALAASTSEQARVFESVLRSARAENLLGGWIHLANSASVFTDLRPRYDTVRPGISAYGILPNDLPGSGDLRPAMSLRTQIVFLKDVPAGATIGYGSTWKAERTTRVATLPIGYDDGVSWRLSNRGEAIVGGRRALMIGRISMDYTTLDVTHVPGAKVGDVVTLIGSDSGETISVDDVARRADTISYEVVCAVGKRVRRTYVGGAEIDLPTQEPKPSSASAWTQRKAPLPTNTPGLAGRPTHGP